MLSDLAKLQVTTLSYKTPTTLLLWDGKTHKRQKRISNEIILHIKSGVKVSWLLVRALVLVFNAGKRPLKRQETAVILHFKPLHWRNSVLFCLVQNSELSSGFAYSNHSKINDLLIFISICFYLTYVCLSQCYFYVEVTLYTWETQQQGDEGEQEEKHYLHLSICFGAKCASQQKAFCD